ncbi:MAG: hypothetical protein LC751_02320 [Actinobacteria bacterium]|nr:hypothetical protein [Actinomycetota bacterium]
MGKKWARKELQSFEAFEKALQEEISVSSEFDLPLTVLALNVKGGWEERDVRSTLDVLRTVDLIAQPEASEILVALPNTITAAARVVEERLRRTVQRAAFGVASYEQGDTAEELLNRVRIATQQAENPEAS